MRIRWSKTDNEVKWGGELSYRPCKHCMGMLHHGGIEFMLKYCCVPCLIRWWWFLYVRTSWYHFKAWLYEWLSRKI